MEEIRVVQNGPGAAGTAIIKMLLSLGVKDIIALDRKGALLPGREGMNPFKAELAELTNPRKFSGNLAEALVGADVFIGTSVAGCVTKEMVESMNQDAIIFACANPTPEIFPEVAKEAGARVISTGRSDYPNQVNNVLVFPGLFRGDLDARASRNTENMKIAAAYALAGMITEEALNEENILPKPFDANVKDTVANAVKAAAVKDGVSRI